MCQVQLFDWRRKYRAIRRAFPKLKFRHVTMVKGGWNIGFIIDKKYVFKVRKHIDINIPHDKIVREQRITAALAPFSGLRILDIEILKIGEYLFYKYPFIAGRNMNHFKIKTVLKHRDEWGHQIAEFIYQIHNANPQEIVDLKTGDGDGWNHNDICNNVIIDPKTMRVIGIIDWEYAGWGYLETEFKNCTRFSSVLRKSGIGDIIRTQYNKIAKQNQRHKSKSSAQGA